jgi:hypothetical protein
MHGHPVCKQHATDTPGAPTGPARDQIVRALSAGASDQDASAAAGVTYETYVAWIAKGEADRECGVASAEASFQVDAQRARSEACVGAVAYIRRAMSTDWRAAAWYLERARPEEWARHRDKASTTKHGIGDQDTTGDVLSDLDAITDIAEVRRRRAG